MPVVAINATACAKIDTMNILETRVNLIKPFRNNFTHSFCKLDNFIIVKNILNASKRSSLKNS